MNEPGAQDAPEHDIQKAMSSRFLSFFIAVRALAKRRTLDRQILA
jgi:hypothetical protein